VAQKDVRAHTVRNARVAAELRLEWARMHCALDQVRVLLLQRTTRAPRNLRAERTRITRVWRSEIRARMLTLDDWRV
jgi:hypothetical protein